MICMKTPQILVRDGCGFHLKYNVFHTLYYSREKGFLKWELGLRATSYRLQNFGA